MEKSEFWKSGMNWAFESAKKMIEVPVEIKIIINIFEISQGKVMKIRNQELGKSVKNWAFEKPKKIIELSAESEKIFNISEFS